MLLCLARKAGMDAFGYGSGFRAHAITLLTGKRADDATLFAFDPFGRFLSIGRLGRLAPIDPFMFHGNSLTSPKPLHSMQAP